MEFSLPEWLATEGKLLKYTLVVLVVFGLAFILERALTFVLQRFFTRASANLKVDPTNYKFFLNAIRLIMVLVAIIVIFLVIPELREIGLTLGAGAGVLTVIIGFAGQQALSNIVGGIFIVIYKPIRVGDQIQIQQFTGEVEDINLRHTTIRNFENRRIVIPNSVISSETILNSHIVDEAVCIHLEMRISYESNARQAIQLMREQCEKHPLVVDRRLPEEVASGEFMVRIVVLRHDESAVVLRAYVWAANPADGFQARCDLLLLVQEAWQQNGIEIPYPHRTLVQKVKSQTVENPPLTQ